MATRNETMIEDLKTLLVRVATNSAVSFTTFYFRCNVLLHDLDKKTEVHLVEQVKALKNLGESLEEQLKIPNGRRRYAFASDVVNRMKYRGIDVSEKLEKEIIESAKQNQPE